MELFFNQKARVRLEDFLEKEKEPMIALVDSCMF